MAKRVGKAREARASPLRTITIVLLGFVLVAMSVIYKRTVGIRQRQEIQRLQQDSAATQARRVQLDGEIRDASSRTRLIPIAEQRLHMHLPTPDQIVPLPRVRPPGPPTPP